MEEIVIITALPGPLEISQIPDGYWTAQVNGLYSGWCPHPEDRRTPGYDRPLTQQELHWGQVLGVTADELTPYVIYERRETPFAHKDDFVLRDLRLVSAKPFVVVMILDHPSYGRCCSFVAARQVNGGQAVHKPALQFQPSVVPSNMRYPHYSYIQRYMPDPISLKRTVNWVSLRELAEIIGLDATVILRHYAPFSPTSGYDPNVPLARGTSTEVHLRYDLDIVRLYTDTEVPRGHDSSEECLWGGNGYTLDAYIQSIEWNPDKLWVPQTFAEKVIYLISFGYRPGQPLPAASCQIGAPLPVQPRRPLPVLPVEELKELQELRMVLELQISLADFRQEALSALGLPRDTEWREAPESGDSSSSPCHSPRFVQIQRTVSNGQVVIGTNYRSPGEMEGSPYHYSGSLTIFTEDVKNTDAPGPQAILRICFWAGKLVRQLPNGSKGGLCPPEVPADCAKVVERFLLGLGYDL